MREGDRRDRRRPSRVRPPRGLARAAQGRFPHRREVAAAAPLLAALAPLAAKAPYLRARGGDGCAGRAHDPLHRRGRLAAARCGPPGPAARADGAAARAGVGGYVPLMILAHLLAAVLALPATPKKPAVQRYHGV